jgi:hypothetical protein
MAVATEGHRQTGWPSWPGGAVISVSVKALPLSLLRLVELQHDASGAVPAALYSDAEAT